MTTVITKVFGPNPTIAAVRTYLATLDLIGNDQWLDAYIDGTLVWNDSNPANPNVACATANRIRFLPVAGQNVNKLNTGTLDVNDSTPGAKIVFARDANRPFYPGYIFEDLILEYTGPESSQGMVFLDKNDAIAGFDTIIRNCRFHNKSTGGSNVISVLGNHRILIENPLFVSDAGQAQFVVGFNGLSITNFTCVARGAALNTPKAFDLGYGQGPIRDGIFIGYNGPIVGRADANSGLPTNCFSNIAAVGTTGITTVSGVNALVQDESSNFLPAAFSPAIAGGSAVLKRTTDIFGNYRGDKPDVGAAMRVAAAIPAAPVATITSVELRGQQRIVKGTYTGQADSGTFTLTPAATPNGAAAASGTVVLNNGTFTARAYGLPGNYAADQVILTNPNPAPGTCSGGAAFSIAVPAAPTITVTGMLQSGSSVVASGTYGGFPVSGLFTLTAAATPGGAVTQAAKAIAFNDDGTWAATVANAPYGAYGPSPTTATNFSGTASTNSMALTTYAPGNMPPGLPAVQLAPYAAPAFNSPSVANGGTITTLTVENTSAAVATNQPFTVGHPFKQGQLKKTDSLVGKIAGQADVAIQFNPKSTWPDGSVRHALLSAVVPSIPASSTLVIAITRSTAAQDTSGVVTKSALAATGVNALASLVIGGTTYSADFNAALLADASIDTWISGPIATEYSAEVPLKNGSTVHPTLHAKFEVRWYPASGKAKVDVTIENGDVYQAAAKGDIAYDASISIGGATSFAKSAITHYWGCVWKQTAWFNGEPPLHVKFDVRYILDTKMQPNYEMLTITESTLAARYAPAATDQYDTGPMGWGKYTPWQGTAGGRPDLGMNAAWTVDWLISQDKRAKKFALRHADAGGAWNIHIRDRSSGPASGQVVHPVYWPYGSYVGSSGDAFNPNTGQSEKIDRPATGVVTIADVSHHPAFANLAYLLTGDKYYLRELMDWAAWCSIAQMGAYRGLEKGLVAAEQVRGQAWGMRDIAFSAAVMPDDHPMKAPYRYVLDSNLAFYNATYSNNPAANKLGALTTGTALVYSVGGGSSNGVSTWQDDFFTCVMNHAWELGFSEALPILTYKSRFPVGRMTAPGYCWILGTTYALRLVDENRVFYETFAQAYDASNTTALKSLPCGSQSYENQWSVENNRNNKPAGAMPDYEDGVEGYPSNTQPGLAAAVDVGFPGAVEAWEQFMARTVKPDYARDGMYWDIIPRYLNTPGVRHPGAPRNTAAVVNGNAFRVTFLAPVSDGGAPVTSYTVHASTGQTATGAASPIDILTPSNTPVSFYVTATNSVGPGPMSIATDLATAALVNVAPGAPQNISATGGILSAWVAFDAPATDGGAAITSYVVTSSHGETATGTASPIKVTIPADSPMSFRVHAVNSIGPGVDSGPSNTVTATATGPAPDTQGPILSGTVSTSSVTASGFTMSITPGTDNVGIAYYEFSTDDGGSYVANGLSTSMTVSGKAADTTYSLKARARDAANNPSNVISGSVRTSTIVTPPSPVVTGVAVTPATATVAGGASQQFIATVLGTGSPSQSVTWSTSSGTVGNTGVLTAPAATDTAQTVIVTATSTADSNRKGIATVTVPAQVVDDPDPDPNPDPNPGTLQITARFIALPPFGAKSKLI